MWNRYNSIIRNSNYKYLDNIAIYYKKKRLIKVFSKILKELKNSKEGQGYLPVRIAKKV